MNKYKSKSLKEDKELKKNYDNLELKYKIIDLLINYRQKHNLTQKELAEKIGVKQQAISRFEKGLVNPRIDFIQKILTATDKKINIT